METQTRDFIHIAFFINDKYACHCATTIVSILKNAKNENIKFHIINEDLSDQNKRKLNSLKSIRPFEIEYVHIDKSNVSFVPTNVGQYITNDTNSRLKIASLLPQLDKVICLDCDLTVQKSLSPLWEIDLTDFESACAFDPPNNATKHFITQTGIQNYFNTGVMLANLKKWRENNTEEKIFLGAKKYANIMRFSDQDTLNIAMNGKIRELDGRYNVLASYLGNLPKDKQEELFSDSTIIHWAGPKKPWNEINTNESDKYWPYAKENPFYIKILKNLIIYEFKNQILKIIKTIKVIKNNY